MGQRSATKLGDGLGAGSSEPAPGPGLTVPEDHAGSLLTLLLLAIATGFPARLHDAQSPRMAVEGALAPLALRWASAFPQGVQSEAEGAGADQGEGPATDQEVLIAQLRTL